MKHLREQGKVRMDENGFITLTDIGREIAERIYERHLLLTKLLMQLGVEEAEAAEEACRIEHDISQDTFEKLKTWAKEKGVE